MKIFYKILFVFGFLQMIIAFNSELKAACPFTITLNGGSVVSTRVNPFLVCRYNTVQLTASTNNSNYNWGILSASSNNTINININNSFGSPFNSIDSFVVTDNCGPGNGTESVTIYFKVFDVKVNPTSGVVCLPGGSVNFNASVTSGFSNPIYAWSPSTGLSSNSSASVTASPSANTTYQVIASSSGCADTTSVSVTTSNKPTASFTYSPASPICSGTNVSFTNTSIGTGLTYSWNFGDGTPTKTSTNPSHVFSVAAGAGNQTYNITLTITNAAGCTSVFTAPITVWEAPSAILMPLQDNCLQAGSSANYQLDIYNLTPPAGVSNFSINWGDGNSNVVNPVPQYGDIISHNYSTMGNFIVTLTTSNAAGCTTIVKDTFFNGSNPSVGIANPGNTSGCYPNSSYFTFPLSGMGTNPPGTVYDFYVNDGSSNIAGGIPTISWAPPAAPPTGANFSITQTIVNGVVQTFFNYHFLKSSCGTTSDLFANSFKITLIARNPCGISQSSVTPIYINEAPQAAFKASDTLICVGSSITFTSTTIAGQIITPSASGFGSVCSSTFNAFWNVSPSLGVSLISGVYGFYSAISGSNAITCQFNQPGTFTVRLITRNACFQNDTALRVICVVPQPIPSFIPSIKKGCAPLAVNIQNNTGPSSNCQPIQYKWRIQYLSNPPCAVGSNFSFTNSTDSTSVAPSFNFVSPGRYVLLLLASNKCGTFVKRDTITVKDKPQVSLPTNPNVCSASQFIVPNATVLNCGENAVSYSWVFNVGVPATSNSASPGPIQFIGSTTHSINLTVANECGSANASTSFTMYPPVKVLAGKDTQICQNKSLVLSAQVLTGTSPYGIVWTPAANLTNPNSLTTPVNTTSSGSYIINIVDANACIGKDTVIVNIKPLPVINVASPTICLGSNATLLASGASVYTWSPTATLSSASGNPVVASPVSTTTYIVSGLDTFTKCSNTQNVVVTVVPIPVVSVSPSNSILCVGDSVTLNAFGASSYSWSPASTISSNIGNSVVVFPTANTTYIVTGTNGATSCSDTAHAIIVVKPLPNVKVNSGSLCAGSSMSLTALGANTYTWSPFATLSSGSSPIVVATPSTTTTYIVTGTDLNQCQDTAHAVIVVNPLPTLFSGNANFCYGSNVTLNASGANVYSWSPSTGLNTSVGASVIASPSVTTTYTLNGMNTATGCSATQNVVVSVNPLPTVNITPSPANGNICIGASATLTASGANSYVWSPNSALSSTTNATVTANPTLTTSYVVVGTNSNGCVGRDTQVVTVSPLPVLIPIGATICNGSSGTISVTGANTYIWTAAPSITGPLNSNNAIVNSTVTTSYTVTGTNTGTGCTNTASVVATVVPLPSVTISGNNTICLGDSTTLTASGANTYTWTAANGLAASTGSIVVAKPTVTTTYTVTGTNTSTGCSKTATYIVTVNTLPVFNVPPISICKGNSGTLTASSSTLTYAWTPTTGLSASTGTSVTASPSVTTTYQVTGTNATTSCNATQSVVVTVNALPTIVSNNPTICAGGSTTLTVTGANTYVWSPSTGLVTTTGSSISANPSTTTSYIVTGTDANGCINKDTSVLTVNPLPTISILGSTAICAGDSTLLTASGANTYIWSPATGLSGTTSAAIYAHPTTTTIYTVVGTNTVTGCSKSQTITVTVNPLPVVSSSAQTTCLGTAATLSATPSTGMTYTWSPSTGLTQNTGASVNANPSTTTTYTVVGVNANGCKGSTNVVLTVLPLPTVSVNNLSICQNASGVLTATGANTYTWSPSTGLSATTGNTVTANPTTTTSYNVTGTSAAGCTATATANVTVLPLPNVTVNNATICPGATATLTASGANTYTWTPATNLNTTTGATVLATPTITSTYTVLGTASNGCSKSTNAIVTMNVFPVFTVPNASYCNGSATYATLTASVATGVTYNWSPTSTLTASSGTSVQAFPSATTTYTVVGTNANGCSSTQTAVVTLNTPPNVTVNSGSFCAGGNINLIASGATNYSWTPTSNLSPSTGNNVTASPATSTTYLVTGTDANGCSDTAYANVIVNAPPTINANNASICPGGSVSITASGANSYAWTPSTGLNVTNAATVIASPSITTVYTITGTSAQGCIATKQITVTVNTNPSFTVNNASYCSGSTNYPTLTASVSANMSYVWSPAAGLNQTNGVSVLANPSITTTYTVVGTNLTTNCSSSVNAIVTVNTPPTVTVNSGSICAGSSLMLNASGANTYVWTPSTGLNSTINASVNANPTVTTTYIVTGTNTSTGCTDTALAVVTVNAIPNVIANGISVCPGTSATLTASGANSYSWTPNTGLNTSNGATVVATPTIATTYTVTGTSINGCSKSDTAVVSFKPVPVFTVNNASYCNGSSTAAILTPSPTTNLTFTWSPSTGLNQTTSFPVQASPSTTTTYSIQGTNTSTGCSSTATAIVTVNPAPVIVVNSPQICIGSSATLSASGANTYTWTPTTGLSPISGATVNANPTATTTYIVTGTNSATNCSASATSIVTVNPLPTITITPSTATICAGGSVGLTASGANTYTWSPTAGLNTTTSNVVSASPITNTNYTVIGLNTSTNCSKTATVSVMVNPLPVVSAGPDLLICNSLINYTILGATPSGGSWSGTGAAGTVNGAGVFTPSGIGTSTLVYSYTNPTTLCTGYDTMQITTVPLTIPNAGADFTICANGASVNLSPVSPLTGTWSGMGVISNIFNPLNTPGVGNCNIVYSIGTLNCVATDTIVAHVIAPPSVQATHAIICQGSSASINASGATSYLWSPSTGLSNISIANPVVSPNATTTYTVVGTAVTGCTNSDTAVVVVKPLPVITNTVLTQNACSGVATTPVSLLSNPSGATYTWNVISSGSVTNIIPTSGTGNLPIFTFNNLTNHVDSVVISIIPSLNGCSGPPKNYVYYVNPLPVISVTPSQKVCSGANTISYTATSNLPSPIVTSYSWVATGSSISLSGYVPNNNTATIPSQSIVNTSNVLQNVQYVITPSANGCLGTPITHTLYVEPTPNVIVSPTSQVICSNTSSNTISFNSNVTGVTYAWNLNLAAGISNSGVVMSGAAIIPPQLFVNSSNSPKNATYTTIASLNDNGLICSGPPSTSIVQVNPIPTITASALADTICNGMTSSVYLYSTVSPTIYAWTCVTSGAVTGYSNSSGSTIAQSLTNASNLLQYVTYNVTSNATFNGVTCPGNNLSIDLYVVPSPIVNFSLANDSLCSGMQSNAVSLSSTTPDSLFTWTASSIGVSGYSVSGTSVIPAQTLINTSATVNNVVYTAYAHVLGCTGPAKTYILNVKPIPQITNASASQSLCSGSSTNAINLTAIPASSTVSWTLTSANGLAYTPASGVGIIPAQVLVNPGNTIATVSQTAIPSYLGCVGSPMVFTQIVNPIPVITLPADQTICSNTASQQVNFVSNLASGTTYSWTAVPSAASVSGFTASGTSAFIPVQTLVNNSSIQQSVTYTITPTANACVGSSVTYTIYVNPAPNILFSLPNQVICSGTATNLVNITSTSSPVNFTWNISYPASISGLGLVTTGNASIPSQTFTNNTNAPVVLNFNVGAALAGSVTCPGSTANYSVTVNPPISITATPLATTICSGANTSIQLNSNVTGTTYTWTVNSPSGVTGASASGGSLINQTLVNTTNTPQVVTYTIVGHTLSNGISCNSAPITQNIQIAPAPVTNFSLANQSICSGSPSQTVNLTSTTANVSFAWTCTPPAGINGAVLSGTGTIGAQILINNNTSTTNVNYVATASVLACTGPTATYTIAVKPLPQITNAILKQTICSGASSSVVNFTSTPSATSYTWNLLSAGAIGGAAASGTGSLPAMTLSNTTNHLDSVVFEITPSLNGCDGPKKLYAIKVTPLPNITLPLDTTICSGTSFAALPISTTIAGTTYSWNASSVSVGISGYTTLGTSNPIPSMLLNNTLANAGVLTYSVTPSYLGCVGIIVPINITVNPSPVVSFSIPTQTICSGSSSASVSVSSSTPNTQFNWTVSVPVGIQSTGLVLSGVGNTIPSQVFVNNTTSPKTITYSVIASTANGTSCNGTSYTATVIVNPIPTLTITPASATICSGTSAVINISSNLSNTSYTFTAIGSAGISGYSNGNGAVISQVLTNTTATMQYVDYTITPTVVLSGFSCVGSPVTQRIYIQPSPIVTFSIPNQTICSQQTSSLVTLNSTTAGVTYAWTATVPFGINGAIGAGTNTISAQTLTNNSLTPLTITYQANASIGACTGNNATYTITVNPIPVVSLLSTHDSICSGTNSTPVNWISIPSGSTFSWSISTINTVSGATNSGVGNLLAMTLLNNTVKNGTYYLDSVVYAVNATLNGCPSLSPAFYTIYVKPLPVLTISGSQTICSDSLASALSVSANPTIGTSFNWQSSVLQNSLSNYTVSSTNSTIASQSIHNNGVIADTLIYTVTGTLNGCAGIPLQTAIYVNPAPQIQFSNNDTFICSGAPSPSVLISSASPNVSFSWNAIVPSGISAAGLVLSGTNVIPSQTFINNSTVPLTVNYVTQVQTTVGATCPGAVDTFKITINPNPVLSGIISADTICYNTNCNIQLSSNIPGTIYTWTANPGLNISGQTSGVGALINQQLLNSSVNYDTVSYSVIPTFTMGGKTCPGFPFRYLITVAPSPIVSFTPSKQWICSDDTTQAIILSSTTPNCIFAWNAQNIPAGLSGVSSNGINTIPAMHLINTTKNLLSVQLEAYANLNGCIGPNFYDSIYIKPLPSITTTPLVQVNCSAVPTALVNFASNPVGSTYTWNLSSHYQGSSSNMLLNGVGNLPSMSIVNNTTAHDSLYYLITPSLNGCIGFVDSFLFDIKPLPVISLLAMQTICSATATVQDSFVSSLANTTYQWTGNVLHNSLTGYLLSGATDTIPSHVISNPTALVDTVVYSIIPNAELCQGPVQTLMIAVNPSPITNFDLTHQYICNNSLNSAIHLSSTTPNVSYTWSMIAYDSIIIGSFPITGNSDSIPVASANFINTDTIPHDIVFNAFATTNGAANCNGPVNTTIITVNPTPDVIPVYTDTTICSNATTAISLTTTVPNTYYSWTVLAPAVVSGASNGTGSSITQQLTNASAVIQTLQYTITPHFSNGGIVCDGAPVLVNINVQPIATLTFSLPDTNLCSNQAFNAVALLSTTPGATFTWIAAGNGANVPVAIGNTDTIPSQAIVNPTNFPVIVNFNVTPFAGVCPGVFSTYNVTVQPLPKPFISVNFLNCVNSLVTFTNGAINGNTYVWDFGDQSAVSTAFAPTHFYSKQDSFNVKFVVTSLFGCKDSSITKLLVVDSPSTKLHIVGDSSCGPALISFQNLTDTSAYYTTNFMWDLGNGSFPTNSPIQPLAQSYNVGFHGDTSYYITLTATNFCGSRVAYDTLTILDRPHVNFVIAPNLGCSPLNTQFINNSLGTNNAYTWNFGDGTTSNVATPSLHTYSTINKADTFYVTLFASNKCGTDNKMDSLVVLPNQVHALANVNLMNACAPALLTYVGASQGATSWYWHFQNGNVAPVKNYSQIISTPGVYVDTFYATDGCGNDTAYVTYNIHPRPLVSFNVISSPACLGNPITFTNTSSATNAAGTAVGISALSWDFGDGTSSNFASVNHTYTSASSYNVQLIATSAITGCIDSITIPVTVNATPVVSINAIPSRICVNGTNIPLVGNPGGGTFTGQGVVGNNFIPSTAGNGGPYIITYTYTSPSGCTNTATTSISVDPLPALAINPIPSQVCINGGLVPLTASPSGGTFSGLGVIGNNFDPAIAGVGGPYTITYTYTSTTALGACTNTTSVQINVVNKPTVTIAAIPATICVAATPLSLSGSPVGGLFSGTGIVANTFNPAFAGVGPHTFTYTYTDPNGCTNSISKSITVQPTPIVTMNPILGPYCYSAPAVPLTAIPSGGSFTGTGVVGNTFVPATAGVGGPYTIYYTYTNAFGCSVTVSDTVSVYQTPAVSLVIPPTAICINASPITLGGNPFGGVFSGVGVVTNTFNPSIAGAGNTVITYSYTDLHGCVNTDNATIVVNPLPVLSFVNVPNSICTNANPIPLNANPTGGIFSGTGVVNNTFDPSGLAIGNYTITYAYTDANGCSNTINKTITINPLPIVTFNPLVSSYCVNAANVALTANPSGGVFTGNGVQGNNFVPAIAGVGGPYTITYTYTNPLTGCAAFDTQQIIIDTIPVVNILPTPSPLCLNHPAVTLVGTPVGGVFNGVGMVGNQFSPNLAGVGTHIITYTTTGANGCTNYVQTNMVVNAIPVINFTNPPATICINANSIALVATPAGGVFTGNGVTGATFNPATAGVGVHTITYTYSDPNGCTSFVSKTISVLSVPVITINTLPDTVCFNGGIVNLFGNPVGGTFSGIGVVGGNTFNPVIAGIGGPYVLTYSLTQVNGCTSIAHDTIYVDTLSNITINPIPTTICQNGAPLILSGVPAGGTFTGNGVVGNLFYPNIAGPGVQTITYTIPAPNPNSCSNNISISINVIPAANVQIYPPASVNLCANANSLLLTATPAGGVFSGTGTGVIGNSFNPQTAGVGSDTMFYHYANANGCISVDSLILFVRAAPINNVSLSPLNGCAPLNISTTNSSLNVNSYLWDFGDATQSVFSTPSHVYTNSGVYQITYTSTNFYGCQATTNFSVTVLPSPTAGFNLSLPFACTAPPVTITSTNTSSGANTYNWTWNNNTQQSSIPNPVFTFNATGTYPIQLIAANGFGCADTFVKNFVVSPQPVADFFVMPLTGCAPLNATLQSTSTDAIQYYWYVNNQLVGNAASNPYTFLLPGVYDVALTVTGPNRACPDSSFKNTYITVYSHPTAMFTYSNVNSAAPNTQVDFFNQSMGANTYQWIFDDGETSTDTNPTHYFHTIGYHKVLLVAMNGDGCTDTFAVNVFTSFDKGLYVPDAFTPNSDDPINKVFLPVGTGLSEYHIWIYDTWGGLLFESTSLDKNGSPNEAWNGNVLNGDKIVPQDVYTWYIEAKFEDGTPWKGNDIYNKRPRQIGTITILR